MRASFTLTDVAPSVGLDFRHGAFRYTPPGEFHDETAMMGGGVCWIDYDRDGWLDLYVVNGYAETDAAGYRAEGAFPKSRLYRNVRGQFRDVTAATGAGLGVRGSGCVAADLDGNGATDLYVTTAGYDVARDAYDALLWNDGHGRFTEGAWTRRDPKARVAHRRRRRRCRRRREARRVRIGLHGRQRPDPRLRVGLPC